MASFGIDNPSSRSVKQDFQQRDNMGIKRSMQLPPLVLPGGAPTRLVPNGLFGGIAFERGTKLVHYSDGMGWYPLSTSAVSSVNWQPGGVATGSTGTTWAEVYERLQALPLSGRREIILDPSLWIDGGMILVDPFLIPAGTYDLSHAAFITNPGWLQLPILFGGVPITVADGVKLNGLREVDGPINIEYRGLDIAATPPVFTQTGAAVDIDLARPGSGNFKGNSFVLSNGAFIRRTGTAPFIEFTDTSGASILGTVVLKTGAVLGGGAGPTVSMLDSPDGTGTTVAIGALDDLVIIDSDSVRTLGVANTPVVSVGFVKVVVEDMSSIGGLPFVSATDFPSVDPVPGVLPFRFGSTSQTTTQVGAPAVTNDDIEGFVEGDIWINIGVAAYILLDNSTGAAVWSAALP